MEFNLDETVGGSGLIGSQLMGYIVKKHICFLSMEGS
jgi:hypothetical protein